MKASAKERNDHFNLILARQFNDGSSEKSLVEQTNGPYSLRTGAHLTHVLRHYYCDADAEGLFYLSDPYYITQFAIHFKRDMREFASIWSARHDNAFHVLVLPILCGFDWYCLRITLDERGEDRVISYLWDDPNGRGYFSWPNHYRALIQPGLIEGLSALDGLPDSLNAGMDASSDGNLRMKYKLVAQLAHCGDVQERITKNSGVVIFGNIRHYLCRRSNDAFNQKPEKSSAFYEFKPSEDSSQDTIAKASIELMLYRDRDTQLLARLPWDEARFIAHMGDLPALPPTGDDYKKLSQDQAILLFHKYALAGSEEPLSKAVIDSVVDYQLDWPTRLMPFTNFTTLVAYYHRLQDSVKRRGNSDKNTMMVKKELNELMSLFTDQIANAKMKKSTDFADWARLVYVGDRELTANLLSRLVRLAKKEVGIDRLRPAIDVVCVGLSVMHTAIDDKMLVDLTNLLVTSLTDRFEIDSNSQSEVVGHILVSITAVLDCLVARDIPINLELHKTLKENLELIKRNISENSLFSATVTGKGIADATGITTLYKQVKKRLFHLRKHSQAWHYFLCRHALTRLSWLESDETLTQKRGRQEKAAKDLAKGVYTLAKAPLEVTKGVAAGAAGVGLLAGGIALAASTEGMGEKLLKPAITISKEFFTVTAGVPFKIVQLLIEAGFLGYEAYKGLTPRSASKLSKIDNMTKDTLDPIWPNLEAFFKEEKTIALMTDLKDYEAMQVIYFLTRLCDEEPAPVEFIETVVQPIFRQYYLSHDGPKDRLVRHFIIHHTYELIQSGYPLSFYQLLGDIDADNKDVVNLVTYTVRSRHTQRKKRYIDDVSKEKRDRYTKKAGRKFVKKAVATKKQITTLEEEVATVVPDLTVKEADWVGLLDAAAAEQQFEFHLARQIHLRRDWHDQIAEQDTTLFAEYDRCYQALSASIHTVKDSGAGTAGPTTSVERSASEGMLSTDAIHGAKAALQKAGKLSAWGRQVEFNLRQIISDYENNQEEDMSRDNASRIKIKRRGKTTIKGNQHTGTFVAADPGNEETAVKAAALYEKLTAEEGGMTIEIDEDVEKTIEGHLSSGFLIDTKQRSNKGLPIAPDSPIAPPPSSKIESSVAVITDSGSFKIGAQEDGIYRVEIDYSDFNHDGANEIHAILERYTENRCYLGDSCVINRHLNLITSLDFVGEGAARKLIKELNNFIADHPSLRFSPS